MQKNLFYNYIADYKDRSGNDLHNIFQIPTFAIKDEQDGAMAVKGFLLSNGYTPMVIVSVTGDYTMDELERMAEGKLYSKEFLADCIRGAQVFEL